MLWPAKVTPAASGGRYELALPPASAAMVTISLGR
jgi:hypothetical protein